MRKALIILKRKGLSLIIFGRWQNNSHVKRMNLQTQRLHLRPILHQDLQAVHDLHSLPEVDEFNTLGIPETIDETKGIVDQWILSHEEQPTRRFTFAMELKDSNQFIGLIGINLGKEKYRNAEVWFKLHPNFWNRGFATEALKRLLAFGFDDLKLHRIEAGCAIGNLGSVSVLEKVGMKREAHTRELLPLKSGWSDNYGYAILEGENLTF